MAAMLPRVMMRNCWMKAPPDLPNLAPTTSTVAFPFTLSSWLRGMYDISLVGSKREYLADLLMIF